jgi:hypothetical protein
MADIPDSLRYILEALRTPAPPRAITLRTGERAGQTIPVDNPNLHPIEQRRDGYRQYLNEFRAGSQEGTPLSYEEWISQEQ